MHGIPAGRILASVKIDWYLLIGSLFLLVFIATRWLGDAFVNGLGVGLGLIGLIALGVGIGTLRNKKQRKAS